MSQKHIVVVGTSFAGYTAALKLREGLGAEHKITVIDRQDKFVFIPSLIWYPFGIRKAKQISFAVSPVYKKKNIDFMLDEVLSFDLDNRTVITETGKVPYDYLVVATGPKVDFAAIPGLKPGETSNSICTIEHAEDAKDSWEKFLQNPGPVVVGAAQEAACFGAAYEFVFNVRYQLKKNKLLKKAPIHFVTSEPFLGHFGIGGFGKGAEMCTMMFKRMGITGHYNTDIKEVTKDSVTLGDGTKIDSKYTMIIPRFRGVDAVVNSKGLANPKGFIPTTDEYQHVDYPEVYAAGIAVAVAAPFETQFGCAVPKTGYPSEVMAEVAAHNIIADITGEGERHQKEFADIDAKCIMDAGNMGMIILGDKMLGKRKKEKIIPGPWAHWGKLAFEAYFMYTRRRGKV